MDMDDWTMKEIWDLARLDDEDETRFPTGVDGLDIAQSGDGRLWVVDERSTADEIAHSELDDNSDLTIADVREMAERMWG